MIGSLWVLPALDPEWRDACMATLDPSIEVVVVDNTGPLNRGVAASWNLGARVAIGLGYDHLVVLSEAVRFGSPEASVEFAARVAASTTTIVTSPCIGVHLVAFRVDALRRVGPFDVGFWPAYCEDADWLHRAELLGPLTSTRVEDVDVHDAGVAHSLQTGRVRVDLNSMERRYFEKWGGPRYAETFDHPWNDPTKGVDWPGW